MLAAGVCGSLAAIGPRYCGEITVEQFAANFNRSASQLSAQNTGKLTRDGVWTSRDTNTFLLMNVPPFGYETDENGNVRYCTRYGLKAYFPLARGFDYSHYDDFGVGRSYGYKRRHLGHDMMGLVGTPVMAVESGYVEALGWNQYGGWRIGIRSFDKKRYYYYAHLRQNYPYQSDLKEGSIVTAGDVIGYLGRTGYSTTENVNNIEVTHLHWGLELIFNEAQKESDNEIWIDVYPLTRFLAKHTQAAQKVEGTKEWVRTTGIKDPEVEKYCEEKSSR